jgi:uncharacterized damage-inducible protein DinB
MAAAPLQISNDFCSTYRDIMLRDLAYESRTTQRVIGRIPEEQRDYKPHPVSRSAWELARHIVTADIWFLESIASRNFNLPEPTCSATTVAELVRWYEESVSKAADKLRTVSSDDLTAPLDFFRMANLPAVMYLDFAKKHAVHHRGQLSVYLRPMGAKVPDIFGGSADEPVG